ncbi:MAG: recombinase family protein [Methanobacteriota archaeon]|nr:MAG: recombinase family protein [Euryarchaeota archaeon]
MESPDLRAALYTRVSTEDQAKEGFSLEAQLERLKSYCQARGWIVYKEFVDDGYSGRDIRRPAYQAMMAEMENWDVLLVLKMDRIHRNSRNFMEMMDELRKHNKEFVSMTESLDTSTAMGRFVVDIIQRIAQLESEQIGERVYAGMHQKAKTPVESLDPEKSPYLGFNHPFGYDYSENRLFINEEEAKTVKKIYSRYLDGKSMGEIAKELNRARIPTKRGGRWDKRTVANILKNPLYCGDMAWDGIVRSAPHEAIVDRETFNRVQQLISKKRARLPAVLRGRGKPLFR